MGIELGVSSGSKRVGSVSNEADQWVGSFLLVCTEICVPTIMKAKKCSWRGMSHPNSGEPCVEQIRRRSVKPIVQFTPDLTSLMNTAAKWWPDAVETNSGIVLALARIDVRDTLSKKTR